MFAVGETLQGRYRILREIGAGGMGTVYEGENLLIRRRVAIKVMREDAVDRPELCARFELEAQIASQIPSDHITEVLDLGELDGGCRFIVMEYLVGESLAARLERVERLDPSELIGLVRQVLVALGAAHRAGVIHRDVKPENVFILSEKAGHRDFVKLLDFGISKLRPAGAELSLTESGVFMGTPTCMAPEQMGGARPSPLWDLYAVGLILYRGLTGEAPFQSQGMHDLLYKVALGTFARPSERVAGLDPALDALVCKAMARFPEQRFQSAEQFISALDDWSAGAREAARPSTISTAGLRVSSRPEPLPTPESMPAPARVATPILEAAATLPDALPVSAKFGVGAERRAASKRVWVAVAGVALVTAALFAGWRTVAVGVENTAPWTETRALEPASLSESGGTPRAAIAPPGLPAEPALGAQPAPAIVPAPAVAAPAITIVPSRAPSGAELSPRAVSEGRSASETRSVPEGRSVAPVERHSRAPAAISKSGTPVPHVASHAKPPQPARVAPIPVEPSSHAQDSGSTPRPDWGY